MIYIPYKVYVFFYTFYALCITNALLYNDYAHNISYLVISFDIFVLKYLLKFFIYSEVIIQTYLSLGYT